MLSSARQQPNQQQCSRVHQWRSAEEDIYLEFPLHKVRQVLSFSPLWRISMAPPALGGAVVASWAIRESLNILLDCKLRKY